MADVKNNIGEEGAQRQVQVKFFTSQKKYAVTDKPFTVPSNLRRYGLSEVINHLLPREEVVPFEFLINGEFLRGSLESYMKSNDISLESLVEIEYMESLPPPQPQMSMEHDDWVSAVKGRFDGRGFLTGSYDHMARFWDASGNCLITMKGHQGPIKDVAWVNKKEHPDDMMCLTASQDESLRLWKFKVDSNLQNDSAVCEVEYVGHTDGVECVAIAPSMDKFVSGSWDKSIKFWGVHSEESAELEEKTLSSKKQKLGKQAKGNVKCKRVAPLGNLNGHSQVVSSIEWLEREGTDLKKVVSGSWDHTLRLWDIETGSNVLALNGPKAIYGIGSSKHHSLVASGHADNVLRIWDMRAESGDAKEVMKMAMTSHDSIIASVAWSPSNAQQLASVSYDGSLKIWDIRSKTPMYTIKGLHDGKKGLCVDWACGSIVATGGSDNQLRLSAICEMSQ
eukprot:Nk52_evm38s1020 gene=Nk52_evmTU38s1020